MAINPETLQLGRDASKETWKNVFLLEADQCKDELKIYLYRWAIVLTVLSAEVFDAILVLTEVGKSARACNVLIRSLIDYSVRLRYYYVQSKMLFAARSRGVPTESIKPQVHAISDWDESEVSLVQKLNRYDSDLWTEESRERIVALALEPPAAKRSVPRMLDYLISNEAKNCGILPMFHERVARNYRNEIAEWVNRSIFVHGDQAVVSDVITFEANEGFKISRESPYDASVVHLLSAVNHIIALNHTVGDIRGWSYGGQGLFNRTAALFAHRYE